MRFKRNRHKGFSIIEVIIALTIISIAFVAVATLVGKNLRANTQNQRYLTAHFLNQEAMEVVRNLRDSAWLNNYSLDGEDVGRVLGESLPTTLGEQTVYYKVVDNRDSFGRATSWSLDITSPGFELNRLYESEAESGRTVYSARQTSNSKPSTFARYLAVTPLNTADFGLNNQIALKVLAITTFGGEDSKSQVEYATILTDWKQGAL